MLQKLNDVLSLFTPERRELTPSQIVDLLGRPKSTVYRQLSAMEEAGFLDRDEESGRYRLGIRLAALGELARQSTSLQRAAHPRLGELSEETDETADLSVLRDGVATTIDVVESHRPLMIPGLLGGRIPLHATAAGKVLLGWRPEEEVRRLLSVPLERFTRHTVTDVDTLLHELQRTRNRGFSTVNGEWVEDILGVSAPVRDHSGDVIAALAVGGPRTRLDIPTLEERLAPIVVRVATDLSRALAWVPELHGGAAVPST